MNPKLFYAKNKEELKAKIEQIVTKYSGTKYQEPLEKWLHWYNTNYDSIILNDLDKKHFYRAYFNNYGNEEVFCIQIWKESDLEENMFIADYNVYSSSQDEYDNDKTIYLS